MHRCAFVVAVFAALVPAQESAPASRASGLPDAWVSALKWRSIGPAGMGGRVTSLAVNPQDSSMWWVGLATGGLVKTSNNGTTFEHQFDRQGSVSVGDVAVSASNPDIVWVGTGESNPRNSVSYGDGVYKSTDGGKTWTHMGLEKTFQIGKVIVHPTNPDVVYVGALGRLWGPNEERGLFKTTDGGKTWSKILYFDADTGVIDAAMSPRDPETLIVCMWARRRDGFDAFRGTPPAPEGFDEYDPSHKWGPHAGLYRTSDGGKSFKKLTQGLPSAKFGRTGIDWYEKDPNVVYAIVDCENIGMGAAPTKSWMGVQCDDAERGAKVTGVTKGGPAEKAGLQIGDVALKVDGADLSGYAALLEGIRTRKPGDVMTFAVKRGEETLELKATLEERPLSVAAAQGTGPVPAYLGLSGEEVPEGIKVGDVPEGSPAEKAGVKSGDVVKALDDEPITGTEQLNELIRTHRPADAVKIVVQRGDEALTLNAVLSERPAAGPGPGGQGGGGGGFGRGGGVLGLFMGATVRAPQDESVEGLEIFRVTDDRNAERAGLAAGDVIKEYDGIAADDVDAFNEHVGAKKEGDSLVLKYDRKGEVREATVKLESDPKTTKRPFAFLYAGQMPNVQTRQGENAHEYGGVYRSDDAGETWKRVNSLNPRPMYFSKIRVDPSDDRFVYVLGVSLHRSTNGGKTFTGDAGAGVHADFHALWIDPRDGRRMITGCDGGFYATWDRAKKWEHLNHLALGQFYHACVDSRFPARAYGGLQDNGSWGGPTRSKGGSGILNEDWINVGGGDGFVCRVDPFEPDIVYSESQNGAMGRRDLRTGRSARIAPRAPAGVRYRFNWNTPFILSSHNPGIFYAAGNYVFRSLKRGDDLKAISPEITATGRGTATALAESPRDADVLWVGTDDGALWVTKDGGREWTNVTAKVGLPGPRHVATIEASRNATGRAYVAFDAHRSDDDEPYVYVTENYGETWKSIRGNLPRGSSRCLREDPTNRDLLYCGTEFAAWASHDRGKSWTRINNNLPTVPVHEFAFHATNGEMVAATHGRSLWVLDVTALRAMDAESLAAPAALYPTAPIVRYAAEPSRGLSGGTQRFVAQNPPNGAPLVFSLNEEAKKATLRVYDVSGAVVRELNGPTKPGLHVVNWDLSLRAPGGGPGAGGGGPGGGRGGEGAGSRPASRPGRRGQGGAGGPGGAGGGGGGQGGPGGFGRGRTAPLGSYRIVLDVDGKTFERTVKIDADPNLPVELAAQVFTLEEQAEAFARESEEGEAEEAGSEELDAAASEGDGVDR